MDARRQSNEEVETRLDDLETTKNPSLALGLTANFALGQAVYTTIDFDVIKANNHFAYTPANGQAVVQEEGLYSFCGNAFTSVNSDVAFSFLSQLLVTRVVGGTEVIGESGLSHVASPSAFTYTTQSMSSVYLYSGDIVEFQIYENLTNPAATVFVQSANDRTNFSIWKVD